MSVTVRPYRRGGWEVDVWWRSPGTGKGGRRVLKVTSNSAAKRWEEGEGAGAPAERLRHQAEGGAHV